MKLSVLLQSREVIDRLYQMRLDGKRALKLRKAIKALTEELKTFDEARDQRIKEVGTQTEAGYELSPESEEFSATVQYLNEMADSEVTPPEPILTEEDLETMDLSVEDIDRLESIGLLNDNEN